MSSVSDVIFNLVKKKFPHPCKSEGWFSEEEAIKEGGLTEKTTKEVLREGVKSQDLEVREFIVWDETRPHRTIRKNFYREGNKKK